MCVLLFCWSVNIKQAYQSCIVFECVQTLCRRACAIRSERSKRVTGIGLWRLISIIQGVDTARRWSQSTTKLQKCSTKALTWVPLSFSSRSLAVQSAAVIQHSQPASQPGKAKQGRQRAYESTPAWWLLAIISSLRLGAVSWWLSARRWRSMGRARPLSSVDGLKPLLPAALKTRGVIYISTPRWICRQ